MTENPFIYEAQQRLVALIDEAETELIEGSQLARYQVGDRWGVEPWVMAMMEVDASLVQLQDLAVAFDADRQQAREAIMKIVTTSFQALALLDEAENGDALVDDGQLATFLETLKDRLDQRISRLREHRGHTHWSWTPPEEKDQGEDVDVIPGLAFTEPFPGSVAGEGPVQDPPAASRLVPDEPLYPEGPGMEPDEIKQAILDSESDPDTRHQPDPVDLDAAERALARESAALRVSAGGSSAAKLGGRHASPDDTQPDMGESGRRTKED